MKNTNARLLFIILLVVIAQLVISVVGARLIVPAIRSDNVTGSAEEKAPAPDVSSVIKEITAAADEVNRETDREIEETDETPPEPALGGDETGAESGSETTASVKYSCIREFVNSDEIQAQLRIMSEQSEPGETSLGLEAEENKLTYIFTFSDGAFEGQELNVVISSLNSALDSLTGTFESVAASISETVDVENPVVEIVYKTSDGATLCSREFSASEE